jgi:hypothetical protein
MPIIPHAPPLAAPLGLAGAEPTPTVVDQEPALIQRERAILSDLVRGSSERARAEQTAENDLQAGTEAAEIEFRETQQRLDTTYYDDKAALEKEFQKSGQDTSARYEAERGAIEGDFANTRHTLEAQRDADQAKIDNEVQEARWSAASVLDAHKAKTEKQFRDFQEKHTGFLERLARLRAEAQLLLGKWVRPQAEQLGLAGQPGADESTTLKQFKEALASAEAGLRESRRLFIFNLVKGKRFLIVVAVLWLLAVAPAARGNNVGAWLVGGSVAALVLSGLLYVTLVAIARRQVNRSYDPFRQALDRADVLCERLKEEVTNNYDRQMAKIQERHDVFLGQAEAKHQRLTATIQERYEAGLRQADAKQQRLQAATTQRRDTTAREIEEKYPRLLAERQERYENETKQTGERHAQQLTETRERHAAAWRALTAKWQSDLARINEEVVAVNAATDKLFPDWPAVKPDGDASAALPPVIRFGSFRISRTQIQQGVPKDAHLHGLGPVDFALPSLMPFPDACSMLFKVGEEGRLPAEQALQAVMFRVLGALPPGKARFTVIDPVGLGQSFAVFMHLADYDDALVSSRIWTEHHAIEQCLTDLTAHMEKVIQKYLRNQFQSIVEYNVHAGEVAEAFRFLVVANFPANFSPEAARRLVSIVNSGARCGVQTLISVDTRIQLPPAFQLKDLEAAGAVLVWKDGRFLWHDPDFGKFPFRADHPPEQDVATRLMHVMGQQARDAKRVEVPFSFITPPVEAWWTSTSRTGIQVPLGRSGATQRQHLQLGKGTAQHVLIAGKTGSGKSTLLHALITNMSLMYGPDEVEFYLVDFKEGVEFKPYASYELPHARLVAIESEREFGLSVLQQLEGELKRRGDLFRAEEVQDLNGYRQSSKAPLPRILLIVDEFQLFFVEDDKIAQDAALLLDRLVRQGRAFGIHVLLGSQTLGGLLPGAQHDRPDGGPHCLAVQRVRCAFDSQRRQSGGATPLPAWRGYLQRRQRPGRGE